MSNFSSEACPDSAESIYMRQCWEFLLPESPAILLDVIHYVYSLAWTVDIFRNFVTILIIFFNKNSDGLSCKAQIMFVLAGICRFSNDFEANEWIFFFPKYIYLIFAFGLLLVAYTFRSREDMEYDDQSLLLLIIGCVVVTLLRIDERLSMSLVQLSLVLEVAALIAQSSLNQNKRAESLTTNFFLTSWFYGKILMNCYCTILSYVNIYRFRVAGDMGFRHFATHGYYNTYNCMLLGYFYNHTSMRKIQNEKLKKLKKLVMCRSDQ